MKTKTTSKTSAARSGKRLSAKRKPELSDVPVPRERLMKPPPKMSEEEEKLWAQFDLTELEYRRINRVRKLPQPNAQQCAMLKEHDELERRMEEQPEEVFREAHQALDKGTTLLTKLIRSGRLHERFLAADGTILHESDNALTCLISRSHHLNSQLLRLAAARRPDAAIHLFSEARRFAGTFIRLAQAHPEDFTQSAEGSLTMPSLRAADPGYTADAAVIAKAIHLGEKHPAAGVHDQRDRFGSLCHLLIAEFLNSIHRAREDFHHNLSTAAYVGVSVDEYIKSTHYPDLYEHVMACSRLPEWSANATSAASWWEMRVLPMVKEEFQKLARDPSRNPALWRELQRRGETRKNTLNDMRRTLEKNCKNKFDQFAKSAHKMPAYGQGY